MVLGGSSAVAAEQEPTCRVAIYETTLRGALGSLFRQCGAPSLYPPSLAGTRVSTPVSGRLPLREVLRRLLRGTNLRGQVTAGGVVAISQPAEREDAQMDGKTKAALAGGVSAVISSLLGSLPAQAQEQATTSVGEVVVTAQRREERLLDVPAAITAISGEQLERRGVRGVTQIEQVTPGLNFSASLVGPQPTIRGIGGRGANVGDEATVPLYVDGIYQPAMAGMMDLNSIERVEVLKGPQGALLGRNAMAGAINIITRTPSTTPQAEVTASYGRFHDKQFQGYVTAGDERLAGDLAVTWREDDGYSRNVYLNKPAARTKTKGARGKLLANVTDNLSLTFAASTQEIWTQIYTSYEILDGNTIARRFDPTILSKLPTEDFQIATDIDGYDRINQQQFSLTAVAEFDGFTVTALGSLQQVRLKLLSDSDATPVPANSVTSLWSGNPVIGEIYAVSNGEGRLDWILGGSYYHDRMLANTANFTRSLTTNAIATTILASGSGTDSYAAYAQATYDLGAGFSITGGGRYTSEKRTRFGTVAGVPATGSETFHKFTPNGVLSYKPNEDLNIYAKAGQAFKSGLFNVNSATAPPVRPETVTQYELGAKTRLAPGLHLNAAIYYTDYKDLQVAAKNELGVSALLNAGRAKIKGGEIELTYSPSRYLDLYAGGSIVDAEYDTFKDAQVAVPTGLGGNVNVFVDASGNRMIRTPKYIFSAGGTVTVPLEAGSIQISGNLNYQSKQYWDASNRLVAPSRTLINGELSWIDPSERYRLSVYGDNLLDETYQQTINISTSVDAELLARPRSYGVRVTAKW